MNLISVSGYKDAGKSTLCRALLARLKAMDFTVGYIKHTQEYVCSEECTDSGAALALDVDILLWGENSFRYEGAPGKSLTKDPAAVAARFFPNADAVILEGGKELPLPKIWVLGRGEEPPDYPGIFALYDRYGQGDGADRYGADEIDRLASALAERIARKSARLYIGDRELPMKGFVADFVGGGLKGMISSLKGVSAGEIRVYIHNEQEFL